MMIPLVAVESLQRYKVMERSDAGRPRVVSKA